MGIEGNIMVENLHGQFVNAFAEGIESLFNKSVIPNTFHEGIIGIITNHVPKLNPAHPNKCLEMRTFKASLLK